MDSIPIVVITGQVAYSVIGTDAFQEADTVGITMPVTKHNWLVSDANDIPRVIREAFHVATTGRPGPVLVDFPKDIANQTMEWYWPEKVDLPGYKPTMKGHPKQIKDAARSSRRASKPVILAGGGILKANATNELRELAELANLPVVTTLMARGVMPDAHPLCLGMPGMHGNYTAVTSMQKADLLINLGARFDDRVTGDPNCFAQNAKVIHVDIDPAELGKVRRADVPIVGDAKNVIIELIKAVKAEHTQARRARHVGVAHPAARVGARLPAAVPAARRRTAEAAVRGGVVAREHARRLHPRGRCRPAPDVGEPAVAVPPAAHVGELRRARHDGLRGAGRGRRQGRPARSHGVGHRR